MANQPKDILTPESFNNNRGQIPLPNATASLVLGIIALVLCIGYGIMGIILGGIGFYLAQQDKKLYEMNEAAYTAESISSSKAGRICSLLGLILGSIFLLGIVLVISFAALSF